MSLHGATQIQIQLSIEISRPEMSSRYFLGCFQTSILPSILYWVWSLVFVFFCFTSQRWQLIMGEKKKNGTFFDSLKIVKIIHVKYRVSIGILEKWAFQFESVRISKLQVEIHWFSDIFFSLSLWSFQVMCLVTFCWLFLSASVHVDCFKNYQVYSLFDLINRYIQFFFVCAYLCRSSLSFCIISVYTSLEWYLAMGEQTFIL